METICTIVEISMKQLYVSFNTSHAVQKLTLTAYTIAKKLEKTLKSYEKAHAWRELFALVLKLQKPRSEVLEICGRVTGRYNPSAIILS
jgi:tRNA C32,U32 (ribose-2'-O)-methylase TrmJ